MQRWSLCGEVFTVNWDTENTGRSWTAHVYEHRAVLYFETCSAYWGKVLSWLIMQPYSLIHWLAFVMRLAKSTKDLRAQISFPWGCISYWNKTFRLHVTKDSFWKRKTAFSSCHSHEWWFASASIWLDKHLDAPMKSRWVINNLGLLSQNNFPEF